jgi:hypothetical protein
VHATRSASHRRDGPIEFVVLCRRVTAAAIVLFALGATLGPGMGASAARWPASYFTGPLGTKNILPATRGGALVGIFHRDPNGTLEEQKAAIRAREAYAGRRFDVYHNFLGGAGTYNGIRNCAHASGIKMVRWVHRRGGVPLVSWTPKRSTTKSLLRDINKGRKDACFRAIANRLGQYRFRIMLRPMHEFDQGQYGRRADGTSDYPNDGSGKPFIAAWRRIVRIFERRAPRVGFFWCPIDSVDRRYQAKSYPGNAYVDWVGADRYNRAAGWPSPLHPGWAEFWEMLNYPQLNSSDPLTRSVYSRYSRRKPFFVGETSSKFDTSDINRKGNWYRHIARAKRPRDSIRYMRNLIGVSISDFYAAVGDDDWRVDRDQGPNGTGEGALSPESYAGWRDWVRSSRWNVGRR